MSKSYLLVLLLLVTQVLTMKSQEKGELTKEAHPMAWAGNSVNTVIFRKNSLVTHDSIQFMAYYNQQGYLCLGKRTLSDELWEIRQTAYQGNIKDAHNSISIMTDGAGYLHVSWDHHGHPLNYAKSMYPLSLELGSKQSMTATTEQDVTYPEFYKVGISVSGNHDNNIYTQWWGESFHGVKPVKEGDTYRYESKIPTSIELAPNLQGKLLLIHGDMDINVHPANTVRLADALIRAGRRFDMMIMPGQDHGIWGEYYENLIRTYFMENLLNVKNNK
jgi:hypothetical protein